jgi:KRAB domain-containing zinc finger protein
MESNKRKAEESKNEDTSEIKYDFVCDINSCSLIFDSQGQLNFHRLTHKNSNNEYKCDFCEFTHKIAIIIQTHTKTHTFVNSFICEINGCVLAFDSHNRLHNHRVTHRNSDNEYKCDFCEYKNKRASLIINHRKTHTGENLFICSHCEKYYVSKNGLSTHLLTHDTTIVRIPNYLCDFGKCTFAAFFPSQLAKHKISHSDAYEFQCIIGNCKAKFKRKDSLVFHIDSIHNNVVHTCQETNCGKKYKSQYGLNRHIDIIHLKIRYECDECDSTFTRIDHVEVHKLAIHIGEKRFKCTHCYFATNKKSALKRHIDVHEKQQFYQFPCHMQDGGTQQFSEGDVPCHIRCKTQLDLEYHIERNHTQEGLGSKYESETKLANFLKSKDIEFTRDRENFINFTSCSNIEANKKSARPDFYLICKSVELKCIFFIENDEFGHRQSACDFQRLYNIVISLRQKSDEMLPIVFVRFNPHHYQLEGVYHNMSLKDGHEKLYNVIQCITPEHLKHDINLVYINYDHTDGKLDVFNEDEINDYADLFEKYVILDV